MKRRYLLFDLDNTLYSERTGLLVHLDQRIEDFVVKTLAIGRPAAQSLRLDYRRRYGTTLRGLMENHGLDPRAYIDYVYDVDLDRFLRPDPALSAMLGRLPWPKAVFSNSPAAQVARVLAALGLGDRFDRIFGLEFANYVGKPDPMVYRRVLAALGLPGEICVMIDDYAANLAPASALGMTTVLLGRDEAPWIDLRLGSILELEEALLGLEPVRMGRA
ncbi:MAG: pyrimidine 5'-nucleotidase [Firmicutes bacterium]|nr:pyrimidine 5'-nucleotidase [Bacillota bacterium]